MSGVIICHSHYHAEIPRVNLYLISPGESGHTSHSELNHPSSHLVGKGNFLPRAAQGQRHQVGWWPPWSSGPQGGTSIRSAVKLICWNTEIWLCSPAERLYSNSEVTTKVLINNLEISYLHHGSETLFDGFPIQKEQCFKNLCGERTTTTKNAFPGCFSVPSFQQEQFFCSVKCSGNRNL